MAKNSLYKDIECCLKKHSSIELSGHSLKRVQQLASLVYAIICCKRSGIYTLASKLQGKDKQAESRVKQAKRWLDSKWTDHQTHFACYIEPLLKSLASSGELVLCIDGSEVCENCISLMLSVYYKKRALPIVWLVRQGKKGHFSQQMHLELLQLATKLIPKNCSVVFLGDGEFSGEELIEALRKLQWSYVLRTKLNRKVDCGNEMASIGKTMPLKGSKYLFIPNALPHSNAVLWHEAGFDKPIPLLTNMELAHQACLYYKKRFSIETMFSDIKSRGFNLHKAQLDQPKRVEKLMIAVALAYLIIFLWGIAPFKNKFVGLFYRKDRVMQLSPFNRGLKTFEYCHENQISLISLFSKNFDIFFCVRL